MRTRSFPGSTTTCARPFVRETELFLDDQLKADRSIVELLTANYTFLNEQLARHYGISGVYGSHFRRVTLADENRWGLLGKASVLAVTSYPTRTSPTIRGKWLLENILAAPVPPPPPDVNTNLDESKTARPRRCARCWSGIARTRCARPVMRAWIRSASASRTSTRSASGARRTARRPINATGVLLDGTKVDGPAALRRALVAQKEQFVQDGHGQAAHLRRRPRDGVLRRSGDPRDRARGGGRRLPLVVDDSGDRQEHAVSDEEVAVMIVTKKAISRRTVLRGIGTAVALPLLDAMVPALTAQAEDAGEGRAPPRRRLPPQRRHLRELAAEGRRPRLRALAHARAARAVPRSVDRRHGALQPSGRGARRRRRRSLARVGDVPDRRPRQEVGQRRRERHLDGPDRGEGARARDAAVVAAADRGRQQPGGILRRRLQLRLQQHAVVADADAAADGGEQPARGLRAAVRIERQHRSARARVAPPPGPQHSRFGDRPREAAAADARPGGQHEGERLPRVAARRGAADSEGRRAERAGRGPTWISRPVFPTGSSRTCSCSTTCSCWPTSPI